MERIRSEWAPRNEYTRPLTGQPNYRNAGVIYAIDRYGARYSVGEIAYEQFDEENFQYVLTPYWDIVDTLTADTFQGIPGIDMDMRLPHYYRVNYTPVFITERTPSENRENLWELLDAVGLDYYDRMEWLIRTKLRSGNDNLIVERRKLSRSSFRVDSRTGKEIWQKILREAQYGDEINFPSLRGMLNLPGDVLDNLYQMLRIGMRIHLDAEKRQLSEDDIRLLLPILMLHKNQQNEQNRERQSEGIRRAQQEGKYHGGRKKTEIDEEVLSAVMNDYIRKRIDLHDAMRRLNLQAESSFYRRLRDFKAKNK